HHLIDPMRPTRQHTSISPIRLIRDALAVRTQKQIASPKRPASGSVLSSIALYQHVVFFDPGKSVVCMHPVPSATALTFDRLRTSRHFPLPGPPILAGNPISGLHYSSLSLQPADLLASLVGADQKFSSSQQRLLHP